MKSNSAFSGLEAAIVLIAFVVVAAVFSYVMLGAGFFATQKSQEVTYSGIKQATSNLVIDGSQYGEMGTGAGSLNLNKVTFYLSVPQGGQPQKVSDIEYTITVNDQKIGYASSATDGKFFVENNPAATDGIIKPGQTTTMILHLGVSTSTTGPAAGGSFTMEVRPKVGAASLLTKQLVTGYNGGVII